MGRKSKAELRLVAFITEEFGEHPGTLLLAGLRAKAETQSRSFIVTLTDAAPGSRVRFLEARADEAPLPRGADPLVLAALLELLSGRGTASRLVFTIPELLKALGWKTSAESEGDVEGALARYYRTSYREVRKRRSEFADGALDCVTEQRLMIGYDLEQEPARGARAGQVYVVVDFNPYFLDQLRRRSLFGFDWGFVRSVSNSPDDG